MNIDPSSQVRAPRPHTRRAATLLLVSQTILLVAGCPQPTTIGLPTGTGQLSIYVDFRGELRPDQTLEPGQLINLNTTGLNRAPRDLVLWVDDNQRTPLLQQRITSNGRLTDTLAESSAPEPGTQITFRANLPIMAPGTYEIAVGDMDGPRTNRVRVTVAVPERRMPREQAAQIWEQGLSELNRIVRAIADNPNETWQDFCNDTIPPGHLAVMQSVLTENERLAQEAGAAYRQLDDQTEQQLQAALWNLGLLPMFEELIAAGSGGATTKTRATASVTYMTDGVLNVIPRRPVHRLLLKADALSARLAAFGTVADIANVIAIFTGGEGLTVTVPVTLLINGARFVFDAVLPTHVADIQVQPQTTLPAESLNFHVSDFDYRWIYWGQVEPPLSLQRGLARLGGQALGTAVNKFFPQKKAEQAIDAGLQLMRQMISRAGITAAAWLPDNADKQVRAMTVLDVNAYAEPLSSTDASFGIPGGFALEWAGDYLLSFVVDGALTVTSLSAPTVDIRAWREPSEEHLGIKHPNIVTRGQTDRLQVGFEIFTFGIQDLSLTAVPTISYQPRHFTEVDVLHRNDYLQGQGQRVWHFDVLGHDASIAARTGGAWVNDSTPDERVYQLGYQRHYHTRKDDGTSTQNQAFTMTVTINGGAPQTLNWSGTPGGSLNARLHTMLTLQPGWNTIEFRPRNADPEAGTQPVSLQLSLPDVLDPSMTHGREPSTGRIHPVRDALVLQVWTPPALPE